MLMSHPNGPHEIDSSLEALIRSRRTIYDFEPEKPGQELVLNAIDAACWAPNHLHTHPWRFYLLGDKASGAVVACYKKLVEQKRGADTARFKGARWEKTPGWLVVTSVRSEDTTREREDYGASCCMVQNLALMLWSAGVGLKWSTGPVTDHNSFFEITGIDPEKEMVVGLFGYGFPAETPRSTRPAISEFIRRV